MISQIRETVIALKATDVATILVEQRVDTVLAVADRVAFVVNGTVVETVAARDLTPDAPAFRRYVGV